MVASIGCPVCGNEAEEALNDVCGCLCGKRDLQRDPQRVLCWGGVENDSRAESMMEGTYVLVR